MLDLVYPMGTVLLSWLLLFFMFSGLGMAVRRVLGQHTTSGWHLLDGFWLGWALALGMLQFWHFAFAVNDAIIVLLGIGAVLALYWGRGDIKAILGRLARERSFLLVFVLLALWLSNRAIEMPTAYDTGYRDIQAVTWIDTFPIVPGLSNLFSSLAYNHSIYLYDALLDTAIWSGRSYHIATGLLLMVYLAYAIRAALQLYRLRAGTEIRWSWIFATLTIPFVMYYTVRLGGITHFLTDTAVDILGFITLIYLLDFLQDWRARAHDSQYPIYRLAIIILTGFTVKQTFVVFGLSIGVLVFTVWLIRGGLLMGRRPFAGLMLRIVILALALILPWMARGVVTSGYPIYPHLVGRIDVDWAESPERLQQRQQNLTSFTRRIIGEPDVSVSASGWLNPWLEGVAGNVMLTGAPVSIVLISLALFAIARLRDRASKTRPALGWWILLPLFVTLLIWFLSYPDVKYVRFIIWSIAMLSMLLALLSLTGNRGSCGCLQSMRSPRFACYTSFS